MEGGAASLVGLLNGILATSGVSLQVGESIEIDQESSSTLM